MAEFQLRQVRLNNYGGYSKKYKCELFDARGGIIMLHHDDDLKKKLHKVKKQWVVKSTVFGALMAASTLLVTSANSTDASASSDSSDSSAEVSSTSGSLSGTTVSLTSVQVAVPTVSGTKQGNIDSTADDTSDAAVAVGKDVTSNGTTPENDSGAVAEPASSSDNDANQSNANDTSATSEVLSDTAESSTEIIESDNVPTSSSVLPEDLISLARMDTSVNIAATATLQSDVITPDDVLAVSKEPVVIADDDYLQVV